MSGRVALSRSVAAIGYAEIHDATRNSEMTAPPVEPPPQPPTPDPPPTPVPPDPVPPTPTPDPIPPTPEPTPFDQVTT
jgi:outer membrane biosynthesis protein TonB